MMKKVEEKSNRANAAGSPYPEVHEQMQKLKYWYKSKLSNTELFILLVMWLKGQLNELDIGESAPHFYRLKSSEAALKNSLRIVKDGGVSWVEYSILVDDNEYVWMPTPHALNNFFWRVLQQYNNYGKPLLTKNELNELSHFWQSKAIRNKKMSRVKTADKRVWKTYISKCITADSMLSSNAKNLYVSKLAHSSAIAYQIEELERIRYQLYRSLNNAVNRIFKEAEVWEMLEDFSRNVAGKIILPFCCEKEARYLTEQSNRIVELKIIRYENHRRTTAFDDRSLGANNTITYDEAANFFIDLQSGLLEYKINTTSKEGLISYYNQVTQIFALQFITMTGLRPTHAISPLLVNLQVARLCVFDKGMARNLLLNNFLQQQIKCYQLIKSKLAQFIPAIHSFPYLFFIIDELQKPTTLTAKTLRHFMHSHWEWHVPYSLRKVFSQTLLELNLPNHLIDRIMGHYEHGEHAGVVNIFQSEEVKTLQVLNQLPSIFKMELFDL
ncbi:hypothetical protein [Psychromonas aquatilis]|uniref:Tyr recombinase domain-containing protein n=1 Tax=Psychromonas aquatilis TaxID=2005072 RepID=A0ABU9GTU8_9GAMM